MANVSLKLVRQTGPRPSNFSPEQFLRSSGVMEKLKRKLDTEDIDPKRVRLNPPPQEDHKTMGEYFDGIISFDFSEPEILVPYEPIKDGFIYNTKLLRADIEELKTEIGELKSGNQSLKTEIGEIKDSLKSEKMGKIKLCIGNLLIDMAKQVIPKEQNDPSTHRLQQLVSVMPDKHLLKAGIPSKYWKFLRDISTHVNERNVAAHLTAEKFAILLADPLMEDSQLYQQWADAFPVVYGFTVEELIEKNKCSVPAPN